MKNYLLLFLILGLFSCESKRDVPFQVKSVNLYNGFSSSAKWIEYEDSSYQSGDTVWTGTSGSPILIVKRAK